MTERYRGAVRPLRHGRSTRNNRGAAHENGAIEGPHGHLKRRDRGCPGAARLVGLRRSRRLSRLHRRGWSGVPTPTVPGRIEAERATLRDLPVDRTADYEPISVNITSSSGFVLRRVFYTVPSRLIGHRLGGRLYDDRLELFLSGTRILTLPRGRAGASGPRRSCRQLPPRHPLAEEEADGAPEPGLSRRAVPARALPALLRAGPAAGGRPPGLPARRRPAGAGA